MKLETPLLGSPVRVLTEESIDDTIREIIKIPGQDDPFMILNMDEIFQKVKNWKLKLPRVQPFYAVKCNTNKAVLKVLSTLGIGFDCASKIEMQRIIDIGVSPSRIIYAHTCKPKSHIKAAAAFGVNTMTFDNEDELYKIKAIIPNARLVIRIRCDAAVAQCPLGIKFGANPEAITPLLTTAKSLGLNVVGVSFHVGSGCQEPEVFLRAIRKARETFDEAINLGFSPTLLDIGGGFPGTFGTSLDEIAGYVIQGLEECFPDESVQVIAEPGRYVVASAFTLMTQVTAKREVVSCEGEKSSFMYYLNDGVYGSFNCILFDHQEVTPHVFNNSKSDLCEDIPRYSSTIWGPTCDSMDQIFADINLPELQVGWWIKWRDMGAYTISAASTFNGFPKPAVHIVTSSHTWVHLEEILRDNYLGKSIKDLDGIDPPENNEESFYVPVPNFLSQFQKDDENNATLVDLAPNNTISSLNVFEI